MLGPIHMTLLYLKDLFIYFNYLLKGSVSQSNHILSFCGFHLQHMNLGVGHDSAHNTHQGHFLPNCQRESSKTQMWQCCFPLEVLHVSLPSSGHFLKWSGNCLPSQSHLSPLSPCSPCPPPPPYCFPTAPGPLHSRSFCLMCVWQSHSLENLFLILAPANESEKLLVFISSSSLPQIPIIPSMYSDTPRSVCVTEPQTELSRPLEGPSPIPDFS